MGTVTGTWFTADLHLGHAKVARLRGYDDPAQHDAEILETLADTIRPGDTLWILGDLSSGGSAAQRDALASLSALALGHNLTMHLIAGNHDGVHPMHRRALTWDPRYRAVFASVQPFARRRVAGNRVWLSHFPWRGGGDHTPTDRYSAVRLEDDGTSWLLHGHTHSTLHLDAARRMFHVGLDAWGLGPVPLGEIVATLEETP